jgi:molybdopterin-binding protein
MRISARSQLSATVVCVGPGAVTCVVTIRLAVGWEVVAVITGGSAATLPSVAGDGVRAVIASTSIVVVRREPDPGFRHGRDPRCRGT